MSSRATHRVILVHAGRTIPALAGILTLAVLTTATAATIHVPGDQPTIQAGLNAAGPADTVLVSEGTFYEHLIWPDMDGITLKGQGRENTIIDGSGTGSVIRFVIHTPITHATVIEEVTITHGFAPGPYPEGYGGGIFIGSASPIVRNVTVSENTAYDFGGGLYASSGSPILSHVVIDNNTAAAAGGYHNNVGHPLFDHAVVTRNTPGGLYFGPGGGTGASVQNSIVAFNYDYGIRVHGTSYTPTSVYIAYTDNIYPVQTIVSGHVDYGPGNIAGNPLFVDVDSGDVHLLEGSPCIDAGDPNEPLDPDATYADMGVFFFDQTVGIEDTPEAPLALLHQNEPNPFAANTRIAYAVPAPGGRTRLRVYGADGRLVRTLVDEALPAGRRSAEWDGTDDTGAKAAAGVYFAVLETRGSLDRRKMVVLR
jgi:predicted outer membrane repeat protein